MKITFNNDNHAIILDINSTTLAKGCLNWTLNAHFLLVSQVLNSIECHTSFTNPLNASMFVSGSVEDCCSFLTFILFSLGKSTGFQYDDTESGFYIINYSFMLFMCTFCDRIFFFHFVFIQF